MKLHIILLWVLLWWFSQYHCLALDLDSLAKTIVSTATQNKIVRSIQAKSELRIFRYTSNFSTVKEEVFKKSFYGFIFWKNNEYFIKSPESVKQIATAFKTDYPVFLYREYSREKNKPRPEKPKRQLSSLTRQPHANQLRVSEQKVPQRHTTYLSASPDRNNQAIIYTFPEQLQIKEEYPHTQAISHIVKDGTQRYLLYWKIFFSAENPEKISDNVFKHEPLPDRKILHPAPLFFPRRLLHNSVSSEI